jgi:translation initiation factor IF-2
MQEVRTLAVSLEGDASQRDSPKGVVSFVDTPGQDIFYRMRNYGASVADVGLLVLAVDEGVSE